MSAEDFFEQKSQDIAIIGMACRFPGAENVEAFWENLQKGIESVREYSLEELMASGVDDSSIMDPNFVRVGGGMDHFDSFDAFFFGVQPREAEIMDPQHRIFLECAWETLENAGYDPEKFEGPIGVFGGIAPNTYYQNILVTRRDLLITMGYYGVMLCNEKDYLATRVSYKLNLRGPSINVSTACSTSGVAVHMACQSLLSGECDMALAGGGRVRVPLGYIYQEGGILSPDGRCRAFDRQANGTTLGNGLAIIVLKRLSEALAEGDTIHALIKGTAINNDGSMKIGFTAPSMQGQALVIAEALAVAAVRPETVGYVEAHGTGTSLGDPIEIAALTKAFREGTDKKCFCPIGSVKTNIGHLDAGAGLAGVIKTVLALKHRKIPPSLNFTAPNPQIDFENSPFYVNTELLEWKADGLPRRAGVSSFGLGGTNVHMVLEEAPEGEPSSPSRPRQLLLLSGKTRAALDSVTANLAGFLKDRHEVNIADTAYTLNNGRRHFEHRRFAVCEDQAEAFRILDAKDAARVKTGYAEKGDRPIAFMFPGQGAQYVNMGLNLYEHEPVFRSIVDQCAETLQEPLGQDIRGILYPKKNDKEAASRLLQKTVFSQPALFTVEYALAKLWNHWGIFPKAMIGHSIGEYVAACLAGVFNLRDALILVAARGRLMQDCPEGAMLSVRMPAQEVGGRLPSELCLASVNAPALCVVSGPKERIFNFQSELEKENVGCKPLHTSHAFHSQMMDPAVEPFTQCVRKVKLSPPAIPFLTNVTGDWIKVEEATDPEHWGRQLRKTVQLADGIGRLWEDPSRILLEVGPRTTSTTLALQQAGDLENQVAIPSLDDTADNHGEWSAVLNAVGRLWLAGTSVNWRAFYEEEKRHRIPLPTYPFERKRFWVEPGKIQTQGVPDKVIFSGEEMGKTGPHSQTLEIPGSLEEESVTLLKKILEETSGRDLSSVQNTMTFLEMGFDSLFLTQWAFMLKKKLGVQIRVQRLFDDLPTLERVASHVRREVSSLGVSSRPKLPESTLDKSTTPEYMSPPKTESKLKPETVEHFITNQLQIMAKQLEMLRQAGSTVTLYELVEAVTAKKGPKGKEVVAEALEEAEFKGTIRPVSREKDLILSSGQQRLWYLDQLVPGSPVFNLPEAFRLRGGLNVEALIKALNEIVRRHEVLRTTYAMGDQGPTLSIFPTLELEVPLVDLSSIPGDKRQIEHARYLEFEAWKPFDLSNGPLVRASILKLSDTEHVLFFMPHHSVFDGWSFGVFQRELFAFYEAFSSGKPSPLPDLPIQYADFAAWQTKWLEGKEVEGLLSYWRETLGGELPALELPADYPRPVLQSIRGSRTTLRIPENVVDSLSSLGRSEGATLFMVLLAGFNILLSRYSGQEDIIVGSPFAGRMRPESSELIGFFVNTLVFRTSLAENPSFREFLSRVRQVCLGAYKHQDLPFERLVEEIQPARDLSRTPVYQVMLAFGAGMMKAEARIGDISWHRERIPSKVAQTDLSLWVMEADEGLSLELEYCTDLFKAETIGRMLGHFEVLLEGIVSDPDGKIGQLPLLTKPEIEQSVAWNATWTEYPRDACISHLFEAQVEKTPDRVAVVYKKSGLTYLELNQRANKLAHYLRNLGVGPDTLVGVYTDRSVEMMAGLLGILKAGGAYVPLDPDYPKERLSYMIEDAQIGVLVTQERFKDDLPEHSARIVYLDSGWSEISRESDSNPESETKPEHLAYVIYTSGSTGKPKGVQVPHGAVVNFLLSMAHQPGFNEDDVLLAVTTLSFDIHVLELYLPLVVGGRVSVVSRVVAADGLELLEALKSSGASVMQATPTTWRLLLAAGWEGTKRLKVLCGGEAFPPDLARELVKRSDSVWNMYGPTETTVWSTVYPVTDPEGPMLIGRPIANTTVHILDKRLQPVPVGVPGELHIGGDGFARGYWNRPELTAERFIPDPFRSKPGARLYKTGDLARYRPDGSLEYLNRLDNQVKVRGFRIELGEIETALGKHEALRQSAVIVKELRPGDTRLVAYVVVDSGRSITGTELRKHLREMLPEYMIPQHFVELDALPLTPAGKIDRKGLTASFKLGGAEEEGYVAPRTEAEKLLAGIWEETLGVERVSVHDNFFEIGGHSLLCMQVIERIRKETGIRLSPRAILLNSLSQIAAEHPLVSSEGEGSKKEMDVAPESVGARENALEKLWKRVIGRKR